MKRVFLVATMCLVAIAAPFTMSAAKAEKVNVCHKGKTLNVSGNALRAHLAHRDWVISEDAPCLAAP